MNSGMLRAVVAPIVLGAGLVGYLASRGSTGALYDASTGELAVAGGGALGVLAALTGVTAPSPITPARRCAVGVLGLAGVVGAALALGDRGDLGEAAPVTPPRAAPAPFGLPAPSTPGGPGPAHPALPEPALALPDLVGPHAGEPTAPGERPRGGRPMRRCRGVTPGSPHPRSRDTPGTCRPGGNARSGPGPVGRTGTPTARLRPGRDEGAATREDSGAGATREDGDGGADTREDRDTAAGVTLLARADGAASAGDGVVTVRLPVLGGSGLVCPDAPIERAAPLDSRR